jgi:glycosyltransferase involved in cell wall biosynthesis
MADIAQIADHLPASEMAKINDGPRGALASFGLAEQPLVSVVITHYNYSEHVADAIQSIRNQIHGNWECVVVDDRSNDAHRTAVGDIVAGFNDERIRLLQLAENVGQIPAFFAGLAETCGEFVCLLDPDDRYAPTFMVETLAAHMNLYVMAPIVCTDQVLVSKRGPIGSGLRHDMYEPALSRRGKAVEIPQTQKNDLLYFHSKTAGWHCTSTSAMMFRRTAIDYMQPKKVLAYKESADSYLAQGCHILGGTLFLGKGLVYRTLHQNNEWISENIYTSFQNKVRPDGVQWSNQCYEDVVEAMLASDISEKVKTGLRTKTAGPKRGAKRHFRRWGRSLIKRLGGGTR